MNDSEFHSLVRLEILSSFEEGHLFCVAARRYKYVEDTFKNDCLKAVNKIPINCSISSWLTDNVLIIGEKSSGKYLAISALYCMLDELGSTRTMRQIVDHLQSLREENSGSTSESSEEDSVDAMTVLGDIYNTSVKPQLEKAVSDLNQRPPDGIHYSTKLLAENKATVDKIMEGMNKFESFVRK